MTARCEPPEGASDGSWHWIEARGGEALAQWSQGIWRLTTGRYMTAEEAGAAFGCVYGDAVPSRDAVRALVEAARGAKEELSRLLDPSRVGFHETMRVLLPLSAALSAFPAQPESKS